MQQDNDPTSAVTTHNLRYAYDSKPVLGALDLRVPKGSIYGLLGPNGCGKSTLFRLLLGQSLPQTGRATILGHDCTSDYVAARSLVGYVPQDNDLPGTSTVQWVLDRFREVYPQTWNQDLAEKLLQRFDLSLRLDTTVDKLSRGMQQRLTLITAVACEPQVLLLDEPTAGLDAVIRRQFTETVIEFMAAKEGRTVLISSHLLSELEPLVDHVGFLVPEPSGSRMLLDASMEDLKLKIRIVELGPNGVLQPLAGHPSLLCRVGDERQTLIFWADSPEEGRILDEWIAQAAGRRVDQTSLSDVFVRLFEGKKSEYFGSVASGHRAAPVQGSVAALG